MVSFFDQLDAQLREVAVRAPSDAATRPPRPQRSVSRRPRSARRPCQGILAALSLLLVTGTALAATGLWRPILGEPRFGPGPTITADAPPPAQLAILGVLRAPQTAADRSAGTRAELRYMSAAASGVRTNYIRLLSDHTGFGPAVLVPVARIDQARSGAPPAVLAELPRTDALCLLVGDRDGEGAAKRCFTTDDVLDGRDTLSLGSDVFGLVPDAVRSVTVSFTGGATRTVAPADNLFETAQGAGGIPVSMTWTMAAGPVRHFTL
jgi:hypothetical protein